MNKISRFAALFLVMLLFIGSLSANAYYYSTYYNYIVGYYDSNAYYNEFDWNEPYLVTSENYENGRYLIYMYDKPSSSGNPISQYNNHTVLKMIEEYPMGEKTYAYVIGPDGYRGFVRRAWITPMWDYITAEPYMVTSEYKEGGMYRAYMYPVPSSGGTPNGDYVNGTIVYVLDYNADKNYAKCLGPDGEEGYILKRRLTYVGW